eukprot:6591837-Pyramimonas_sp.AAC.1
MPGHSGGEGGGVGRRRVGPGEHSAVQGGDQVQLEEARREKFQGDGPGAARRGRGLGAAEGGVPQGPGRQKGC